MGLTYFAEFTVARVTIKPGQPHFKMQECLFHGTHLFHHIFKIE